MPHEQPGYFSYLLRLWQGTGKAETAWRASLECASSGERRVFASLLDAFRFLQEQTGAELATDRDADEMERDVWCNESR